MSSRRRMLAGRPLGVVLSVVMGASMAGIYAPMVALGATPPPPTGSCSNANSGAVRYTTTTGTKGYALAFPYVVFTIAPHQTSGSLTTTATATFTGKATVSGTVKVDASAVLASAEASVGLSLEVGVAFSVGQSFTVGPYTNTTNSYRDATAYAGTRIVTGYYTKWRCDISPYVGFYTWVSEYTNTYGYWLQLVTGEVWCNDDAALRDRYGSWSIQYNAASKCD